MHPNIQLSISSKSPEPLNPPSPLPQNQNSRQNPKINPQRRTHQGEPIKQEEWPYQFFSSLYTTSYGAKEEHRDGPSEENAGSHLQRCRVIIGGENGGRGRREFNGSLLWGSGGGVWNLGQQRFRPGPKVGWDKVERGGSGERVEWRRQTWVVWRRERQGEGGEKALRGLQHWVFVGVSGRYNYLECGSSPRLLHHLLLLLLLLLRWSGYGSMRWISVVLPSFWCEPLDVWKLGHSSQIFMGEFWGFPQKSSEIDLGIIWIAELL